MDIKVELIGERIALFLPGTPRVIISEKEAYYLQSELGHILDLVPRSRDKVIGPDPRN